MNWKTEAMDRLKAYTCRRSAVQSLELLAKELEMEVYSPPAASLKAPIRTDNVFEDRRLDRLVTLQMVRERRDQNRLWLEAMDNALGALENEEKLVLYRFFIQPEKGAVDRLCQELGLERSGVYRLRDKGLERFTLSLFGIPQ